MSLRNVALVGLVGALVVPATAQMDPAAVGLGMVMPAAIRAQANQDAARLRREGRLPRASQASAGTRFVPDLAHRRAQAGKFLAGAKRISPDLAASLAPAFRNDAVRYAAPFLAKYGMKTDDLADMAAVYLVGSWYGVHGKTGNPTRGEVVSVRDQIRRMYQTSPKLRGASNAAKQSVAEGSLYLALLNDALIETMKAHPEASERIKAEVAGGARSMFGLDLRSMRITKVGLKG